MNHNTDPGQYSLFDDNASKEAESHIHQGFPLEPIAGGQEQPSEVSEAWEDIGSHAPPTPEVIYAEQVLNGVADEKAEKKLAARIKSHQDDMKTPGMLSSIPELNPPELTEDYVNNAHAAYIRARAALGEKIAADRQRRQSSSK